MSDKKGNKLLIEEKIPLLHAFYVQCIQTAEGMPRSLVGVN